MRPVAVEAERAAPVDGLRDVAGEDGDEERREDRADPAPLPGQRNEGTAQHDLHGAGRHDHAVGIDRQTS
jgi:hypothetical protein